MTHTETPLQLTNDRTVTLRSASGDRLFGVPALPAAAAAAVAIALAPRLTALAAIGGMLARASITIDRD
jgi:hypothetical protein